MKKLNCLSIVAMAALTCALLIGCTGGDKTPAESESETAAVTLPVAESESSTAPESESTSGAPEETTDYFDANRIELVTPDTSKVVDMAVDGEGYDIYCIPDNGNGAYRYGATYLYNDDGSVDAYFACAGIPTQWDWISYRHSDDNGKTWSAEKVVMAPTPGEMDDLSCCDPGVVYFNGYYYLAYTSTLNKDGRCNNLFIARSEKPDGPFEKWNGTGWGGPNPEPIVYYEGTYERWGIGEGSMVELNGTLYIYYTCSLGSVEYTMVATADATSENWPLTIQQRGVAYQKSTEDFRLDSLDVKYVEDLGKFVAVSTGNRMAYQSWLAVLESEDGLTFELVDAVRENTYAGLHNAGLSSRRNGHIRLDTDADRLHVVYGYGMVEWGKWNARVQPITLGLSDGNDMGAERAKRCVMGDLAMTPVTPQKDTLPILISTEKDYYEIAMGQSAVTLSLTTYDSFNRGLAISSHRPDVTYTGYDENVICVDKARIMPVGVGETRLTITYKGLVHHVWFRVVEKRADIGSDSEIADFKLTLPEEIRLYKGEAELYHPQIRARITYADGHDDELNAHERRDAVTYTLDGEGVITIDEKGVITVCETGTVTVTVTFKEYTGTVRVTVTDDPADAIFRPAA